MLRAPPHAVTANNRYENIYLLLSVLHASQSVNKNVVGILLFVVSGSTIRHRILFYARS